ncbi:hypothetical protein EDC04DRAFT_2912733 [Pisolithus marmoratus]|nr:hypothetical protein EDC04DRAFT_2912733 [Pisolithus marmoratus]
MDYLPELAHDGHNWTAYGSLVLCAIIDDGLMGFLVGSETRPIHPAQQYGRGEGWTPQTDNERDEVAAWKAADQSWTQRNAMVNYTIVSSIPDTIFGCMLHLKSPLEKWDYLEKRFGSIPRPESWVAAEEAMRQSDSQPEQSAAGETARNIFDSHHEPEIQTSGEEDSPDVPNDCAETESGYLTPESEVIDARQVELYLPVVEVGTVNSKQPDERDHTGVASTSIPANIVAAKQPTVVLHKRTEIAYGPMAPEATIVDVQSQVAGSCAANSNEREGDCTEIPTGYLEPETDIIDVQQTEPDEHADMLEVPDERSQGTNNNIAEHQTLPEWISEASDPADDATRYTCGRSIENASIECNEHIPMDGKTVANVPDPPGTHAEPPAPQAEPSALLQNGSSARTRSAVDTEIDLSHVGRNDKLQETRYLELDSKWASRHSQQTHQGHSTQDSPPDKVWGVGVHRHSQTGRGDGTDVEPTTTKVEMRATSVQTVDMQADLPHAGRCPKEPDKAKRTGSGGDDKLSSEFSDSHGVEKALLTDRGCQHSERKRKRPEDLPVMPALHPASTNYMPKSSKGLQHHARLRSNAENESRQAEWSMAIRKLATWDNLPRKEDDGRWGHGDATRSGYADSHGVEESPLTDDGGQHSEYEAKQPRRLPAAPAPSLNGILDMPTLFTDLCRRGKIKQTAESVSNAQTRRNAYRAQVAPKWSLPLLLAHSNRSLDPVGGSWTVNLGYDEIRHARRARTRGHTYRIARILMRPLQPLSAPSKRLEYPMGGYQMMKKGYNEIRRARRVKTRGHTYWIAGIPMRLLQMLSNVSKRLWTVANTYWKVGEPPISMRNDAKRPRNLRTAKRLPRSSSRRQGNTHTGVYSPVPSKWPPNGLTRTPSTFRDPRRHGKLKTSAETVSNLRRRRSAHRARAAHMWPWQLLPTPSGPYRNIEEGSRIISVRYDEVSDAGNVQTRGYPYPGEHTLGCAIISPSRAPRKQRKPPWGLPDTYNRQGVPPGRTRSDGDPSDSQSGHFVSQYKVRSACTTMHFRNGKLPQRGASTCPNNICYTHGLEAH